MVLTQHLLCSYSRWFCSRQLQQLYVLSQINIINFVNTQPDFSIPGLGTLTSPPMQTLCSSALGFILLQTTQATLGEQNCHSFNRMIGSYGSYKTTQLYNGCIIYEQEANHVSF